MKKARTKLYIKASPNENEIVYSGIEFAEFINYLIQPIENLLLLKGDYFGNRYKFNFELLEGQEIVENLTKEDVHNFGDFCFVDYNSSQKVSKLSDEQVAELLYLGHMYKPLQSPFFEPLQNRFVYLSQDDGWFCKLYCRELDEFMTVLSRKITNSINVPLPADIQNRLKQIAMEGILIDLEEIRGTKRGASLKIYQVGAYSNMDEVLNNWQQIKSNATLTSILSYSNNEWSIS